MRGRLLILVGLIILLAVVAFFVLTQTGGGGGTVTPPPAGTDVSQQVQSNATALPTPTPIPLVKIVQALQNLPRGFKFPDKIEQLADVAGYTLWPQDAVPFSAITEESGGIEVLLNKIVRTDIYREQPILTSLIVDDLFDVAKTGSDAAAMLRDGRLMIALPIDRITSGAYGIQDGDHVDVIISMLFVDVDLTFQTLVPTNITLINLTGETIELLETIRGRTDQTQFGPAIIGPSEQQRPRLVTQRTIQDAVVIHVGDFPIDGHFIGVKPTPTPVPQESSDGSAPASNGTPPPPPTEIPRPDIISLAVSPQHAVVLAWAIEAKLPVTLALRAANDTSRVPTLPVTLDFMMSEFNIDLPARRDFSIEPAIRSIRQLLAGSEISLREDTATTATQGQ